MRLLIVSANLACQMLAYSGKGAFDIRNVNLSEIVADNAHLLRSAIAKTVNMEIELDDNMADVGVTPAKCSN